MSKRSNFERKPRDFYATPRKAVLPLIPHLPAGTFIEPCAGDGALIKHLEGFGMRCLYASDLEPQAKGIEKRDLLFFDGPLPMADFVITNPPWRRDILHPMIARLHMHGPTWLLLDAGFAYAKESHEFMRFCHRIVPVGRVKWIAGSKNEGMEDCAWYLFSPEQNYGYATFYFR